MSDLVERLPLSRNRIYQLLESGELVGIKVGAKWLVSEPNVLRWLQTANGAPDTKGSVEHTPSGKEVQPNHIKEGAP